jgi:hypothetical protein
MNGKVEADIRNNATLFPEWLSVVLHAQEHREGQNNRKCAKPKTLPAASRVYEYAVHGRTAFSFSLAELNRRAIRRAIALPPPNVGFNGASDVLRRAWEANRERRV